MAFEIQNTTVREFEDSFYRTMTELQDDGWERNGPLTVQCVGNDYAFVCGLHRKIEVPDESENEEGSAMMPASQLAHSETVACVMGKHARDQFELAENRGVDTGTLWEAPDGTVIIVEDVYYGDIDHGGEHSDVIVARSILSPKVSIDKFLATHQPVN